MTTNPPSKSAAQKRTSKMTNSQDVTHLLNFTLPPRQQRPAGHYHRRGRKASAQHGVWNKERFVNAQYRFIMNPAGDYTVHFADPDIFFHWDDILQVIILPSFANTSVISGTDFSTQKETNPHCPICLSFPSAPRMTRCGHVFCFSCILHYLSTSDIKWARCPICFDPVNEKQLKAVKWYKGSTLIDEASFSLSTNDLESPLLTGSTLQMRLMERPQITTLALPRSQTWPSDLLPPHQAPFHFLPDVFTFAKFMLATPAYLLADLSRDLDELAAERRILIVVDDHLGISFIDAAEKKVRSEMEKTSALETPILKKKLEETFREQEEIQRRAAAFDDRLRKNRSGTIDSAEMPVEFLSLKASDENSAFPKQDIMKSQNRSIVRQRRNVNPPPPSNSTYYFYQAASGLPCFLHPLDIRVLLAYFNSYASFPDTIAIQIEAVAEGTVDDELRKRCKYLGHLSEGTDVVFIEANLDGVVGTEGIKNFEGPLRMRSFRRKEKGRKEDRAQMKAEEREREKEKRAIGWSGFKSSTVNTANDKTSVPGEPNASHLSLKPTPCGPWGPRSFASALHASPSTANDCEDSRRRKEDELELDNALRDLELEKETGARRKRGAKLVVLGSGMGSCIRKR